MSRRVSLSLLPGPFRRLINRKLDARIRAVTGLTPITEMDESDVLIAGYPKSGNTWMQNLVTGIVYRVDPEYASDTLVQTWVPDVQGGAYYRRFVTPMLFKSHELPTPKNRRVVYLLRDGRDVMVSYFHHQEALGGGNCNFLKMVREVEVLNPCKWHQHVTAWLANPYNAQMLVIRYEDLKSNPLNEMQRFCAFLGIERENSFLQSVVAKSSFDKMRQKEQTMGWANSDWPKDKSFVRRGEVNSYKDEMPPEVLDAFLLDAEKTLVDLGYL